MSRVNKRYSQTDRLQLLREFQESGMSKLSFCRKHGISCTKVLDYWSKKYESTKEVVPLQAEPDDDEMANRSKDSYRGGNQGSTRLLPRGIVCETKKMPAPTTPTTLDFSVVGVVGAGRKNIQLYRDKMRNEE